MQRQVESERRQVRRQLENLERRVCEHQAAPAVGREHWADLKGSVSGLLDEISVISRRMDGLEERLLLRTGNCEELVRQRARELEQQLQAQQQKALLAVSTSEEMSKRHTARLQKLGQSIEDAARRVSAIEKGSRRADPAAGADAMHLEARLSELEGQQVSLEDEFRSILISTAGARGGALASTALLPGSAEDSDCAGDGTEFEAMVHAVERDLAALSHRISAQLDDHATTLANLRIRTEGHEQRLSAMADRLETAVAPPLEALRAELAQLREHDRQEVRAQIEHVGRQIQAVADAGEEASSELLSALHDIDLGPRSNEPSAADAPVQRLRGTSTSQEQASNDFCSFFERMEALEQRLELTEPLHHLSQRAARSEAKSAALERRLEQLQHLAVDQVDLSRDSRRSRAAGDSAAHVSMRSRIEEPPQDNAAAPQCAKHKYR